MQDQSRYELHCGNAHEMLQQLASASVHTCVTSPPYWNQRKYAGESVLGNEATAEQYVENMCNIFDEVWRVLVPEGSLWLNIGDTYKNKNLIGIPWRVVFALQERGWILRNAVIWDKQKGNPDNAKDKLRNVYEHVFHVVKQEQYCYNLDSVRNPPLKPSFRNGKIVTPTGVSGDKYRQQIAASNDLSTEEKANALAALKAALHNVEIGEMPDFRMIIRGTQRSTHSDSPEFSGRADELRKKGFCILPYHKNGTKPSDIWRVIPEDRWRKDTHFAVYPTELCEIPIKTTCPPNGIVLDPFVGSGTTVIAALELGRRAIGIDASAEYLASAKERIEMWLAGNTTDQSQLSLYTVGEVA